MANHSLLARRVVLFQYSNIVLFGLLTNKKVSTGGGLVLYSGFVFSSLIQMSFILSIMI